MKVKFENDIAFYLASTSGNNVYDNVYGELLNHFSIKHKIKWTIIRDELLDEIARNTIEFINDNMNPFRFHMANEINNFLREKYEDKI